MVSVDIKTFAAFCSGLGGLVALLNYICGCGLGRVEGLLPCRQLFRIIRAKFNDLLRPYYCIRFYEGDDAYSAVERYLSAHKQLSNQADRFIGYIDQKKGRTNLLSKIEVTNRDIVHLLHLPSENKMVEVWWTKSMTTPKKSYVLTMPKCYQEQIELTYVPEVLRFQDLLVYQLMAGDDGGRSGEAWNHSILSRPLEDDFDNLAINEKLRKQIKDMLDLVKASSVNKWFFHISGPPGAGKRTLVASIARRMRYHIYEVDLEYLKTKARLRKLISETSDGSIIVIDIDNLNSTTHTILSDLTDIINSSWNTPGMERIFVFKSKGCLEPGTLKVKIDMEIPLTYLTPETAKIMLFYLTDLRSGRLFDIAMELIYDVDITAGELTWMCKCHNPKATSDTRIFELIKSLNKYRTESHGLRNG